MPSLTVAIELSAPRGSKDCGPSPVIASAVLILLCVPNLSASLTVKYGLKCAFATTVGGTWCGGGEIIERIAVFGKEGPADSNREG